MRGRQKRLKTVESGAVEVGDRFGGGGSVDLAEGGENFCAQVPNGLKNRLELSGNDCGSFASRCSVHMIHGVVSKFDSEKKELMKSIGFEGILYFPPMKQINRKFSMWLMTRVNEVVPTINAGHHIRMKFDKYDVGRVFGIPSTGKAVMHAGVGSRDAKERVIDRYLGYEFKKQRSIKMVQEVLEREYHGAMSEVDADRFRVAFVVFVVSNLFCPSAKYDYASVDYWNAIEDAQEIKNYDWSAYVLNRLLEAVSKMKQDIENNIKFPNITGCAIFLQVLYLDSLDLDYLSLPHDTFPRIRVFSFDTIRNMMQEDKNYVSDVKGDSGLESGKLRDSSGCIYSWAIDNDHDHDHVESRSESLHAIWETAVAMVHLLGIPLEVAGPVFVAVSDFQEQMNSGLFVTGTRALKFLSVLLTLMTPYTQGFRYQPSYSLSVPPGGEDLVGSAIINGTKLLSTPIRNSGRRSGVSVKSVDDERRLCRSGYFRGSGDGSSLTLDEELIGDDVQRSVHRAVETIDEPTGHMDVNLWVASMMAKFYSLFRMLKPVNDFDLNASVEGDMSSPSSSSSPDGPVCCNALSPWDLGYDWSLADCDAGLLLGMLKNMEKDESMAIVHREPKYIQVSYRAMCSQFLASCEMEVDLFDALVRTRKQDDDLLYASYGSMRWRHCFESDFMAVLLSGKYDVMDSKIRDHLSLSEQSYDLKNCKLVFFPAMLHHHWVWFVWQPETNVISVFDPSHEGRCPEWRCRLVERACFTLKHALFTLCMGVFIGVCHDVRSADLRVLNIAEKCIDRLNRTGVLCSMFYRCFDGNVLRSSGLKADVDIIASNLLSELCSLKGNCGSLKVIYDKLG